MITVTDPKELFLVFGAHRIQGFPSGQAFFTPSKLQEDDVAVEQGVDGNVSITKLVTRDTKEVYMVDLVLTRGSASNTYLWGVRAAQKLAPGIPFQPFVASHKSSKMATAQACVMAAPTQVPAIGGGEPLQNWKLLLVGVTGVLLGLELAKENQ